MLMITEIRNEHIQSICLDEVVDYWSLAAPCRARDASIEISSRTGER